MAICPSEHMHLLLQSLKDNDRQSVGILLAEMVLWLLVPSNPLPHLKHAVATNDAMLTAQETLRERTDGLRAMVGFTPEPLAARLRHEAAEHDQVADALQALCNDTDFFLLQP